jgi:hypothetical protein
VRTDMTTTLAGSAGCQQTIHRLHGKLINATSYIYSMKWLAAPLLGLLAIALISGCTSSTYSQTTAQDSSRQSPSDRTDAASTICTPDWNCTTATDCIGIGTMGFKSRICFDQNECPSTTELSVTPPVTTLTFDDGTTYAITVATLCPQDSEACARLRERGHARFTVEQCVPPEARLGQLVRIGDLTYNLTAIELFKYVGGAYFGLEPDGVFLVLTLTAQNDGKSAQYITATDFEVVDSQGRRYDADTSASIYMSQMGYDAFVFDKLNPGLKTRGSIAFDIPADDTGLRLKISDGLMGSSRYVTIGNVADL